ncbi:glycosyltransferase family 9 protein [Lentiprolixibacter aurantiacus]|uniref:Glycosyltransferase family 9 protein n=1 Tax=Lentiprolixibacter aurantiacus TaxID=2993939 RepID=A0AAE3MN30_9FLAO|nr:glycosyltransferase family 9 protein [Lentiprolixibacter aurantiacus]MCX2720468.1 glycosyltransferase family 9 protein [Lentiprolixibacter aurantiacus]
MSKRILVIQQKMIGDVLASSVICDLLKQKLPDSQVDYVVNDGAIDVVKNHPHIDGLVIFQSHFKKNYGAFYKFLREIRSRRYDIVIDAYGKLESNLITLASGAKVKISYKKWYTSWIYTHLCKPHSERKTPMGLAIENRLLLLEPVLGPSDGFFIKPKIHLSTDEIQKAKELLKTSGVDLSRPLIMIGVLGSSDIKSYPLNYLTTLLEEIIEKTGARLLFNYSPHQEEQVKAYIELCPQEVKNAVYHDFEPGSLRSFLAVLSQCTAYVGNEGGMVNMSKALGLPTFNIFSPWISKKAWDTFNNETRNQAVHLRDYKPELFEGKSKSQLKKESLDLYQEFEPGLIKIELRNFLIREGIPNE